MSDRDLDFLESLKAVGPDGTKRPPPIQSSEPTEEIETVDTVPEVVAAGPLELISKVTRNNVFRHPDAHPIVLDLILLQEFGPEWMGMETDVLEVHIQQHFKTSLSALNAGKIHASNTLHLVDSFWERWEVLLWCVMAFNGVPPDFEMLQVPTVAQVLVAIDIANRIRTDVEWSEEVKHFITAVYQHEGLFFPIAPADFVNPESHGLPVSGAELGKRWPLVRASGKPVQVETIEDEQLNRLLIAQHFLEESRAHLRQQLPLVNHAVHP